MITCRVLSGAYELRKYEYYLKERNMDSRSMYFGCAVTEEAIVKLVDHMIADNTNHHVIVAENDQLEIVGTIHVANISCNEVELGVMVAESYRGTGVSSKMMDYAMTWCRNRGFRDVYMHCLNYNKPILHLVNKYGLEISRDRGDADAHVTLPRATVFTMQHEALMNQTAEFTKNIRTFKKMLELQ